MKNHILTQNIVIHFLPKIVQLKNYNHNNEMVKSKQTLSQG